MKIGVIGAGNIGKKFCKATRLVKKAELVAVASATPGKAKSYAQEMEIPSYYENYEKMLQKADIDCVYICTTHNFHYENLLLCIQYNKHIICEKPLVLHKVQAEDVFAKAKAKNLFVMEAVWTRFVPSLQKAKQWILAGKIGEVTNAHYIVGGKPPTTPNNRLLNPDLAGGALYDIGIYSILNTTFLVNQKIRNIKSFMKTDEKKKVDLVTDILIQFENASATLTSSFACGIDDYCMIYGTKGKIQIFDPFRIDKCTLSLDDGSHELFELARTNGFEHELSHAIERIEGGHVESDIMPHKDTVECAGIFDIVFEQNKDIFV